MAWFKYRPKPPLIPLNLSLFDSNGIDESFLRDADISDLGVTISDSLENPGAVEEFFINNPGLNVPGLANSMGFDVTRGGEAVESAVGALEHFDTVYMAYSNISDLEERLSKQFAYSTLAGGVLFDNQLDLGGAINTDFKQNFVDNALVKGFLYINTSGAVAVQSSLLGGIVDVNVGLDLNTFDFAIDNISVDIQLENITLGSVLTLASGVADLFGAPSSLVNFLSDAAEAINLVMSVVTITSAAATGIFGAAALDPEPVSKVVLSVIGALVSIFNAIFGDDGQSAVDDVNAKLASHNFFSRGRQEFQLREKYLYEFSAAVAPYTIRNVVSDAVIQIYLDGTNLAVAIDFTRDPYVEANVVNDLYGLILGQTYVLNNIGVAYTRQIKTATAVRNYLSKQIFTGGYYVRPG